MSIEIKQVKRYVSKDGAVWENRKEAVERDKFLLRKEAVQLLIQDGVFDSKTEHIDDDYWINIHELADAIAQVGDKLIDALSVKQKRRPKKEKTRSLTTDGAPINMSVTLTPAPGLSSLNP
jgi:hypothetical protein